MAWKEHRLQNINQKIPSKALLMEDKMQAGAFGYVTNYVWESPLNHAVNITVPRNLELLWLGITGVQSVNDVYEIVNTLLTDSGFCLRGVATSSHLIRYMFLPVFAFLREAHGRRGGLQPPNPTPPSQPASASAHVYISSPTASKEPVFKCLSPTNRRTCGKRLVEQPNDSIRLLRTSSFTEASSNMFVLKNVAIPSSIPKHFCRNIPV